MSSGANIGGNPCVPTPTVSRFSGGGGSSQGKVPQPDPDAMSALVASELNQLSFEERRTVFEDIHGVTHIEEESPKLIQGLLAQLKEEMSRTRGRSAYDKALFLSPSYVNDPAFCLMFLRSEHYNVRLAAQRLVAHFNFKLEVFGVEKLAKKITWDDLSELDRQCVESGSTQLLPEKDRSGRTVLVFIQEFIKYDHIYSMVRSVLFLGTTGGPRWNESISNQPWPYCCASFVTSDSSNVVY
jgi:hypothetical protein